MMRVLGALVAMVGMSGCTLIVAGMAMSEVHHSSTRSGDSGIAAALPAAMFFDAMVLGALGVVDLDASGMGSGSGMAGH